MEASPRATLHVIRNTDQQGDETRNFVVLQRRADAVVDYLMGEGVDPARLTTQPAGEASPAAHDATAEADAINRRTELQSLRAARRLTPSACQRCVSGGGASDELRVRR